MFALICQEKRKMILCFLLVNLFELIEKLIKSLLMAESHDYFRHEQLSKCQEKGINT